MVAGFYLVIIGLLVCSNCDNDYIPLFFWRPVCYITMNADNFMLIYLFEKTTSAGSLHKLALQISRVQWPWFYFQLREIIRIFKINKKKEMFVNDSQKISKDKMRMWSTNMSKPEKPPENAFNYQTKRSWTPKVIKVSLFPSIDCPTGSKDQLPNSSSSSGEKETKRCLHLVSWTYSTPFCNM